MIEYNYSIEIWWKHNGCYDREQASGIPYNCSVSDYLNKTEDWWESLSDREKLDVYLDFFEEY